MMELFISFHRIRKIEVTDDSDFWIIMTDRLGYRIKKQMHRFNNECKRISY